MTETTRDELIHDWNDNRDRYKFEVQFDDETLRDGLQSPSVRDPELDQKTSQRRAHLVGHAGIALQVRAQVLDSRGRVLGASLPDGRRQTIHGPRSVP